MRSQARPSRGFTLVELLVVIGIIAILIALLMPGLNAARRQGRAVACLSNLRQMAVAAQAYCNDNGGRFPVAYWTAANDPIYTGLNWDFTVVRDVGANTTLDRRHAVHRACRAGHHAATGLDDDAAVSR